MFTFFRSTTPSFVESKGKKFDYSFSLIYHLFLLFVRILFFFPLSLVLFSKVEGIVNYRCAKKKKYTHAIGEFSFIVFRNGIFSSRVVRYYVMRYCSPIFSGLLPFFFFFLYHFSRFAINLNDDLLLNKKIIIIIINV